ncbi:MAG: pyridoxine 5'-phosphate synthase [Bacteroidia bacterium]|nr:pyridoxine 5'-phosphate synthase [Bacteroidia bacterium]
MARLSVNINKIALLRNSRGKNLPEVLAFAKDIEGFGAQGITVHPRPDERHIRYDDVRNLKKILQTELNVEGNPKESKFVDLICEVLPHQVTLVPDTRNQLTSDHGWDTVKEKSFLKEIIALFKSKNIRVSVFVDPDVKMLEGAKACGADRAELYTERYAHLYPSGPEKAIEPYVRAANVAHEIGLELNAGHDLNLKNLRYFIQKIPFIKEVSIGHALISDALYFGMENTVRMYLWEIHQALNHEKK